MANAIRGNKIFIDSTGDVEIPTGGIKIAHFIFTAANSNDLVTLRETSSGTDIITIQSSSKDTMHIPMELVPMNFQSGLYIQAISSGATLTLVTTSRGAS